MFFEIRKFRIVGVFSLCLGITSCASQHVYDMGPMNPSTGHTVKLIDERQDAEKLYRLRSSNTFNCEFGIYDLGDRNLRPTPMEMLSHSLNSDDNPNYRGAEIRVTQFRVVVNKQSFIRRITWKPAVSESLCQAGPEVLGGVDKNLNPNVDPQITILLNASINEKRVNIKRTYIYKVESPQGEQEEGSRSIIVQNQMSSESEMLQSKLREALDSTIKEFKIRI